MHRRIVCMLIAVVLLFAVCWLPFHAVLLYREIQEPRETDSMVSLVLFIQWLVYANSACNPVVYAILNRGFRSEFLAIVRCKTRWIYYFCQIKFYVKWKTNLCCLGVFWQCTNCDGLVSHPRGVKDSHLLNTTETGDKRRLRGPPGS